MMNKTTPIISDIGQLEKFLIEREGFSIFENAPPVNVEKIARLLGIEVIECAHSDPLDLKTIGKITLGPGSKAKVWINPLENSYVPRKRFTLAHEIGHFCMHRSENTTTFVDTKSTMNRSESYWDKHEFEANNFAADLLMPDQLIRKIGKQIIVAYKEQNNVERMPLSIFKDKMAVEFNVSSAAMEYRLKNLGITGSK